MGDDVLFNKSEIIERCLKQVHLYYSKDPNRFRSDLLCQDAILLNIERACQATIDAAMRLIRLRNLGVPKETREAFDYLEAAKIISPKLATSLKKMVGFRNVAVHDYQKLNLDLVERLIKEDFPDLREFVSVLLKT